MHDQRPHFAPATLRLAQPTDYAGMHRVRMAVRENTLSSPDRITEADYIDAMTRLGRTWVMEVDGVIVGFASGRFTGNIWALFVDPAHEGKGYGTALHAEMIAWMRSLALPRIWLTTGPGTRAEGFYRAQGWQSRGIVAEDEVLMEL